MNHETAIVGILQAAYVPSGQNIWAIFTKWDVAIIIWFIAAALTGLGQLLVKLIQNEYFNSNLKWCIMTSVYYWYEDNNIYQWRWTS